MPASAQDLSFTPGTAWNFSNIQVESGQMQNYLDYLAGEWKKVGGMELQELNLKQPQSQRVTPDPAIERTFQRPLLAHWLAVDVGRRAPWPSFRDSQ